MDFFELKRNLDKDYTAFPKARLAILANFSIQLLSEALRGQAYEEKLNLELYKPFHDNIELQFLDETLLQFKPDCINILYCFQRLQEDFHRTPVEQRNNYAEKFLLQLDHFLYSLRNKLPEAIFILGNFPVPFDPIYGNYATQVRGSFFYQLTKINLGLMEIAASHRSITLCNISSLSNEYGLTFTTDSRLYFEAGMAYSLQFLPILTKQILSIFQIHRGHGKKCLIIDLDNMIWGGQIGDDGIENIQLDPNGQGKVFYQIQSWIQELQRRGIILAVCSKNDEKIAKSPFVNHPHMLLSLENFVSFKANWNNKADNIREIQDYLNLDFSSMVFLDDSPYERNLVREQLPNLYVPELPEDPAEYLDELRRLNLFEVNSVSPEDSKRSFYYQNEFKRASVQKNFANIDTYLASLNMICEIQNFTKVNLGRVFQLIQRSNQFNLRSIRYSEAAIEKIAQLANFRSFAYHLKDRFGDYGLVAVVILKMDKEECFIDTWIMSCRVFKRGLEDFILHKIITLAREQDIPAVKGEYISSPKNTLVRDLFESRGFQYDGKHWILLVSNYQENKTFIQGIELHE